MPGDDPGLVKAVRRELVEDPAVRAAVGSSAEWSVWVFRYRSFVMIEGTGSVSAVVSTRGGWTAPNQHNTMRFPRLQVEIFADPDRTDTLQPASRSAEEKAERAFDAIDAILHVPEGGAMWWGDDTGTIRVLGSHRLGELDITEVPGGDGLVRGLVAYGVTLG